MTLQILIHARFIVFGRIHHSRNHVDAPLINQIVTRMPTQAGEEMVWSVCLTLLLGTSEMVWSV